MRYVLTAPELDLSGLAADALRAVDEALKASVQLIANDAKRAVAQGPKTGRLYTHYFRTGPNGGVFPVEKRGVPHQASAPGEAPATDTGRLLNSIVADAAYDGTRFNAFIEVRTEYATYLEYGTRKMMARPFLIPAVERNRPRIMGSIRLGVATATQRFVQKPAGGTFPGSFPGSEVGTEFESRYWAWRFR